MDRTTKQAIGGAIFIVFVVAFFIMYIGLGINHQRAIENDTTEYVGELTGVEYNDNILVVELDNSTTVIIKTDRISPEPLVFELYGQYYFKVNGDNYLREYCQIPEFRGN